MEDIIEDIYGDIPLKINGVIPLRGGPVTMTRGEIPWYRKCLNGIFSMTQIGNTLGYP